MTRTLYLAFLIALTFSLGAFGCGKDKPSAEACQKAFDHLADVAEKGQNRIPRDKYLAENQGMLKSCTPTSRARRWIAS